MEVFNNHADLDFLVPTDAHEFFNVYLLLCRGGFLNQLTKLTTTASKGTRFTENPVFPLALPPYYMAGVSPDGRRRRRSGGAALRPRALRAWRRSGVLLRLLLFSGRRQMNCSVVVFQK